MCNCGKKTPEERQAARDARAAARIAAQQKLQAQRAEIAARRAS